MFSIQQQNRILPFHAGVFLLSHLKFNTYYFMIFHTFIYILLIEMWPAASARINHSIIIIILYVFIYIEWIDYYSILLFIRTILFIYIYSFFFLRYYTILSISSSQPKNRQFRSNQKRVIISISLSSIGKRGFRLKNKIFIILVVFKS